MAILKERLAEFDLVIVNAPRKGTNDYQIAAMLVASGAAIVVCSAARGTLGGTPLADAEIVNKPFSDEDLLAACRRALDRRRAR